MKKQKILLWSIINSLASFVYILGISWFLFNGEVLFGKATDFWMPAALLLLFVVSATIVGALVLGRPIYLYLNGAKSEAVRLLIYTVAWLFALTLAVFLVILII